MNKKEGILLKKAAELKLKGTEYRVLMFLMPELSFKEYHKIDREELCLRLNLQKSNLATAIQHLVDAELLEVEKTTQKAKNMKFRLSVPEDDFFDNISIEKMLSAFGGTKP